MVSRKKNFPFEKVLWACFLKKAAMQWSAKNLQLWFWLCFWKFQFNQSEKDFQPSFWFYSQSEDEISCFVIFLRVAVQWKWMDSQLSFYVCFPNQKSNCAFQKHFVTISIHWKWKELISHFGLTSTPESQLCETPLFFEGVNFIKRVTLQKY